MQSALTFAATSIALISLVWTVVEFVRFSWNKSGKVQPTPVVEPVAAEPVAAETPRRLTNLRQKWGTVEFCPPIELCTPMEVEAILNPRKGTKSRKSTASSKGGSKRSPRSKVDKAVA